jgi:hypothetical protein
MMWTQPAARLDRLSVHPVHSFWMITGANGLSNLHHNDYAIEARARRFRLLGCTSSFAYRLRRLTGRANYPEISELQT